MPPKVIHIVESLDRGAVENWLVRMLRHAREANCLSNWTFYCQLPRPGALDAYVSGLGARVIQSPVPLADTFAFISALRSELKRSRYDVMHCHHDLVSSVYMVASFGLPIGQRIVHVHNADESIPTSNPLKKTLLRMPMRWVCLTATKVVGISNHTLDTFLAGRGRIPGRHLVHYYGVDPKPFVNSNVDRPGFRRSLGFDPDSLVVIFGGRVTPEKNPVFVIDIFARISLLEPRAVLVFAGDGSLMRSVSKRAEELGVCDKVRIIGWRDDLPALMASCDLFILPRPDRPMEGFGLAVVEAQLAGLRLLLSRGIPDDPLLPSAAFRRLSTAESAENWARAAIDLLRESNPSCATALAELQASPMAMDYALARLLELHT